MISAYAAVESRSVPRSILPSISALFGAYFAVRLGITYLFFEPDPRTGTIVSLSLNILALVISIFCSLGPAAATHRPALRTPCLRWIVAFLSLSLTSLLWSEAVSVLNAFAYWCGMAADVALVLLLLHSGGVDAVSRRLIKGYVVGACIVATGMWLSPTMQDLRPGNDEFFSPNAIGFTCAFGVFLAQYLAVSDKAWRWLAVFLAISLLRSLSKTTIVAFAASELLVLAASSSISRRAKLLILSTTVIVLVCFSSLIVAYWQVYTNAGNQAETLTGRIGIWSYILDRSFERPWLGHGFNSVWKVIPPFGSDRFEAWHAHNELLQQFYAYGVAGIALLFALYGSFYRQVSRLAHPAFRPLFFGLIAFIVIRGLGDTERFDLSFPLWAMALLSLMIEARERRFEVEP